jgi:two-component system, sporulation sensor kinase E
MESERGGAVVILRDVTRDRLEEANVLESERFNAIKLLAAGIAHEVGNPLNALNIHLQLLDREIQGLAARLDAPPESSQESVEEVAADLRDLVGVAREEVTRLDLIISQFLGAIRPTQPNLARTRVEGLLEETLNLLRLEVTNRDIEISIECPEPVPDIRVDRDQMKQAFFNIVRNAFQAMPDGGRLTIRLSSTSQDLVIAFEDSGKGIKREDMGRVFEPYYTSKSKGSGLGLLVVQRIVREHGGALEVSSRESIGTRFVITLPLAERRIRMIGDATKLPIEVGEAIPVELDHADEEGVDSGQ